MQAKGVSLFAIILAVGWVALFFIAKAVTPVCLDGRELGVSVTEIIASGAFFVIACTPVYRSIWLDKKLGIGINGRRGKCGEE